MRSAEKYEIACELEKELLSEAKKSDNGVLVEEGLFDVAWEMLRQIKTGKREKEEIEVCKKMMRKAYYLSLSRNDYTNMKIFSDYYAAQFDESIGEAL